MGPVRQQCCLQLGLFIRLGVRWLLAELGWTGLGQVGQLDSAPHVSHPPGGQSGCVLRVMTGMQESKWKHTRPLKNRVQNCCIINPESLYFPNQVLQPKLQKLSGKALSGQKAWIKRGEKFGPFLQTTIEIIAPWTLQRCNSERVSNLLLG